MGIIDSIIYNYLWLIQIVLFMKLKQKIFIKIWRVWKNIMIWVNIEKKADHMMEKIKK